MSSTRAIAQTVATATEQIVSAAKLSTGYGEHRPLPASDAADVLEQVAGLHRAAAELAKQLQRGMAMGTLPLNFIRNSGYGRSHGAAVAAMHRVVTRQADLAGIIGYWAADVRAFAAQQRRMERAQQEWEELNPR
ncbi:hypothetical protein [Actinokineospora sp. NBRC 105648]|uniref:hypothetical protein n=1 Tax=Actinokineospora sp. NBRC 105648 TaxID=3032206 RepID=UPI0024A556A4|nr:hypothetical protein [Actinokineospora sp. NBRC 105648]GLZ43507.1 hypothetical protein Acsp05_71310 [Actinokineospora sp. NBRC 105648]